MMDDADRTLAGRYRLSAVIGRGGMGTVYRATDLVLGRSVAVKLLPGVLADHDPTRVARFEREARAAAALNHPAVVAVYDTGADATSRFIVMELVVGRSLEELLRDQGRLAPDSAVRVAARVADALAAAHAAGIVHRDIKPANVMVADDGSVKVLDFGIARPMEETTLTQNAAVLGTASYMAPEQALGTPADERSDIYSLGCVLYALLAGHPPFNGIVPAAVMHQHANIAPEPLHSQTSGVSPALDGLVMEMLAKSPSERPQTATQVRDRLVRLSVDPLAAPMSRAPMSTAPTERLSGTAATQWLPPVAPSERRAPRSRRLILAGALTAMALVIALVASESGGSSDHHVASGHSPTTAGGHRLSTASGYSTTTAFTSPPPAPASSPTTATLSAAPATNTPTTTSRTTPKPHIHGGGPPAHPPGPPGHGGVPPGRAKHAGRQHH